MRLVLVPPSTAVVLAACGFASAADINTGRALAERWCSECHLISEQQRQGSTEAPPFSEIAERPGFDAGKVAISLLAPHPPMSGLALSRNEAANLAAYIESQEQK